MKKLKTGQIVYVRMVVKHTPDQEFVKGYDYMLTPVDRLGRELTWAAYPIGEDEAILTQKELIESVQRRIG